jgi:hypothetical protein
MKILFTHGGPDLQVVKEGAVFNVEISSPVVICKEVHKKLKKNTNMKFRVLQIQQPVCMK